MIDEGIYLPNWINYYWCSVLNQYCNAEYDFLCEYCLGHTWTNETKFKKV